MCEKKEKFWQAVLNENAVFFFHFHAVFQQNRPLLGNFWGKFWVGTPPPQKKRKFVEPSVSDNTDQSH